MKYLWLSLCLCGTAFVVTSAPAAPTKEVVFNATIAGGGTCDVDATPSIIQIGGTGDIDPLPAIGADWVGLAPTDFSITLNNCSGLGGPALTPKITVVGSMLQGKSSEASKSLFSTGTNETGFGVIIYNTGSPTTTGTADIVSTTNLTIPIPDQGAGAVLGDTVPPVQLKAAVGCGTAADCAATGLKPGSLSASITFGFAYK
ncbi:P pilus assembly protein, pilin FimA [Serratia proteamaculans]|uniref:hypothetical protein n=1 Tax=Serratia proteamaculans TaxID=28151 RepID=UPI002182EB21|nr:hypothetical protein [Serratia proteamaculans]CAI2536425.1 P pilus assembly protein, pilin FimA [Serratia proteamaculans]